MILMSVGLPIYRSKQIAWLALEGLCRQRGVDFDWELVIAEEDENCFGYSSVMEYSKRLEAVGCVKVNYMPLGKWIPLSDKIAMLARNCSSESEVYVPGPGDYFSPPERLATIKRAWDACRFDWFTPTKLILYNIKDGRTLVSDSNLRKRKDDCLGRAISLSALREAVDKIHNRKSSVDGLVWKSVNNSSRSRFVMCFDNSENWKHGLCVTGAGLLSKHTQYCYDRPLRHQYPCPFDLKETIPADILDRLKNIAYLAHPVAPSKPLVHASSKPKFKRFTRDSSNNKKLKGLALFNLPLPDFMIKRIMKLPPDEMQRACKDPIGYAKKMKWLK